MAPVPPELGAYLQRWLSTEPVTVIATYHRDGIYFHDGPYSFFVRCVTGVTEPIAHHLRAKELYFTLPYLIPGATLTVKQTGEINLQITNTGGQITISGPTVSPVSCPRTDQSWYAEHPLV